MKKLSPQRCLSDHLGYYSHLPYCKNFAYCKGLGFCTAVTFLFFLFYSPLQILAQHKPSSSADRSVAGKASNPTPAVSSPVSAQKSQNEPFFRQQPAAASASMAGVSMAGEQQIPTKQAGKVLEPKNNHCFQITGYDTVYVSTRMTTYLIFPTPIKLLDLGSRNYAGRIEENKLLLKPVREAVPASAMMIETQDGKIYLHHIAYRQQPKRIFWDYRFGDVSISDVSISDAAISDSHASDKLGNGFQTKVTHPKDNKTEFDPRQTYQLKLAYLKRQKKRKLFHEKENNIGLRISGLAVDNTATYMLLEIDNRSSIPYKLDYVSFTYQEKRRRKARRRVEGEENQVLPIFTQGAEMVQPRSVLEMAYAFPLFANTLDGKLEIIIREIDGNRVVRGYVPAKVLAKALYIPNEVTTLSHLDRKP